MWRLWLAYVFVPWIHPDPLWCRKQDRIINKGDLVGKEKEGAVPQWETIEVFGLSPEKKEAGKWEEGKNRGRMEQCREWEGQRQEEGWSQNAQFLARRDAEDLQSQPSEAEMGLGREGLRSSKSFSATGWRLTIWNLISREQNRNNKEKRTV